MARNQSSENSQLSVLVLPLGSKPEPSVVLVRVGYVMRSNEQSQESVATMARVALVTRYADCRWTGLLHDLGWQNSRHLECFMLLWENEGHPGEPHAGV